jgi:predicted RNA-binding Zn-ribbon protein involved in translation (DUF1610 family)
MSAHRLEIVPSPGDTRDQSVSYLAPRFAGPVVVGTSTEDFACGHCGEIIFAKIAAGQVLNLTVRCFSCGAYNRANAA